jgi:hypothetical protein
LEDIAEAQRRALDEGVLALARFGESPGSRSLTRKTANRHFVKGDRTMDESSMLSSLVDRITLLERSYRQARCVAVVLGAVLACFILLAASAGPTVIGEPQGARTEIAANGITIYDSAGKLQIFLGMTATGRPESKVGGIVQMALASP